MQQLKLYFPQDGKWAWEINWITLVGTYWKKVFATGYRSFCNHFCGEMFLLIPKTSFYLTTNHFSTFRWAPCHLYSGLCTDTEIGPHYAWLPRLSTNQGLNHLSTFAWWTRRYPSPRRDHNANRHAAFFACSLPYMLTDHNPVLSQVVSSFGRYTYQMKRLLVTTLYLCVLHVESTWLCLGLLVVLPPAENTPIMNTKITFSADTAWGLHLWNLPSSSKRRIWLEIL